MSQTSSIWLKIRTDAKAGVIRASLMVGNQQMDELSTIKLGPCQKDPQLFEDWCKALEGAVGRMVKEISGAATVEWEKRAPNEN